MRTYINICTYVKEITCTPIWTYSIGLLVSCNCENRHRHMHIFYPKAAHMITYIDIFFRLCLDTYKNIQRIYESICRYVTRFVHIYIYTHMKTYDRHMMKYAKKCLHIPHIMNTYFDNIYETNTYETKLWHMYIYETYRYLYI